MLCVILHMVIVIIFVPLVTSLLTLHSNFCKIRYRNLDGLQMCKVEAPTFVGDPIPVSNFVHPKVGISKIQNEYQYYHSGIKTTIIA